MNDQTTSGPIRFEGRDLPALLTVDDVVALLGHLVSRDTVKRWLRTGRLRGMKIGHAWLVRGSQFVEDCAALESDLPTIAAYCAIRRVEEGSPWRN